MSRSVFAGIDLACGRRKPLPLCFVAWKNDRLEVLPFSKADRSRLPLGQGNAEILSKDPFRNVAQRVSEVIAEIVGENGWHLAGIAIDAPAAPPSARQIRECEAALGEAGLSYFKTPDRLAWDQIKVVCGAHLNNGKPLSRLPYANMIWMLYGFELFRCLGRITAEVIETYPQAIVRSLISDCEHKATDVGYRRQLSAIAAATGWTPNQLEEALAASVGGRRDDRLDAYMSGWVASLSLPNRTLFGSRANIADAIWVPNLRVA
jgi:predicted nuclease with RNAse H fold